ncbi:MAG: restriction endonuclease, partial [Chloroflexota bacterium]
DLLVGRKKEFASFDKWTSKIPNELSKSRVILARRKSGKTSFVQRIFNQLWSQNSTVIPFYFDIKDRETWYPNFAVEYYRAFASQYISFLERDGELVSRRLTLEQIRTYGKETGNRYLVHDVESLWDDEKKGYYDSMWTTACEAPHSHASVSGLDSTINNGRKYRFLVILDEFQNIANYVYRDEACANRPMHSMPGSFHSLSESKVAPMLVTGSYPGILLDIMANYLEAGRLSIFRMKPFLEPKHGLEAVYRYAQMHNEPIQDETAEYINELCMSDPFLISCVISNEMEDKDLTKRKGVIKTVNYELSNFESEMSKTWNEYLRRTFERTNGTITKKLMLFLNKNSEQDYRPSDLKTELNLTLSEEEIYERLEVLMASDVIRQGVSAFRFRGLEDGTLNLILRNHFEEEIDGVRPDFIGEFEAQLKAERAETNKWRGLANDFKGRLAEMKMAFVFRGKQQAGQPINLADYFTNITDTHPLTIVSVMERISHRMLNGDGEEIDIIAKADDGRVVMVEVRDRKDKTGTKPVMGLQTNALDYAAQYGVTVLPAFLSLSGFTEEATAFCQANGIGMAEKVVKASAI